MDSQNEECAPLDKKADPQRFKFTKRKLEALEPQEKITTYHDTEVKGLKLVVSKAGTKTFYVYRKVNGRPERIKVGNFPQTPVELASKQAQVINSEITQGKNRNEAKRALRGEWTLDELFSRYVDYCEQIGKLSIANEKSCYRLHLSHLGQRKLSAVSSDAIKELHKKISAKHPTQANRVLSLIHGLYNKAINEFNEFSGKNPATGIAKNTEKTRKRFLQAEELQRFFDAVAEEKNPVIRDYILMSLLTGARRNNVLAMRWSEINLDRAEWTIPTTKNGDPLTVPLVEDALQVLRSIKQNNQSEFVFPSHGKSGHLAEPKKGWNRIKTQAGIKDLRLHDLRRTLGSWQAHTGASLPIIGKSLGHKSVTTTAIYARLDVDPVRESMERAVSAMRKSSEPKAEVLPISARN